jgi:hypothetical protein
MKNPAAVWPTTGGRLGLKSAFPIPFSSKPVNAAAYPTIGTAAHVFTADHHRHAKRRIPVGQ